MIIFWVLKKRIWKEGFKISRFKRSKFHRVFPKVWIVWKKICMNLAIQMKTIDTFSTAYVKSAFLLLFLNRRYKMEFTSKITYGICRWSCKLLLWHVNLFFSICDKFEFSIWTLNFMRIFIRGLEFCDFFLQFHKMQIFWAANLSNNKVNIYNY